jgi:prepilin-type N-terminal cleavage/methylation domain-containing protein
MNPKSSRGFTLLEVLVAVAIFTLIVAGAIAVLNTAQQRYLAESESLDTFQTARLALDQMIRDVSIAGYPAANSFTPAAIAANPQIVAVPFAWSPGPYPGTQCAIGANCVTPGQFDLIIETTPVAGGGLQWIRYQLVGTTLRRAVVAKGPPGTDPAAATAGAVLVPYITNVINNAPAAQRAALSAMYPNLFPGGNPVPMFTYTYDPASPPNQPRSILEVNVIVIVMANLPDPLTGQPRVVTLTGRIRRLNPVS